MYIFSTFYRSTNIELMLSDLKQDGFSVEDILALPLHSKKPKKNIWRMIAHDESSIIDTIAVFANIFMLLGVIYGFVLHLGPILWGLIGLISGIVLGLVVDIIFRKIKRQKGLKVEKDNHQILIVIECPNERIEHIESMLLEYAPIGIAKLDN
ncbi:hypothetical protein [Aquibacillus rhizosphaerae]|uniref:Uncharacterized protein n=1 Tax=Aquibacillus rhizosphaerae TaxID=3051431 RepID=A0ABT7L284_9BACI|nr:hypothetical protein [Aquibacillus sp. LR5S19]MDL4839971.1 hypothetical protein [Aquibacillus sp. LR5S19]